MKKILVVVLVLFFSFGISYNVNASTSAGVDGTIIVLTIENAKNYIMKFNGVDIQKTEFEIMDYNYCKNPSIENAKLSLEVPYCYKIDNLGIGFNNVSFILYPFEENKIDEIVVNNTKTPGSYRLDGIKLALINKEKHDFNDFLKLSFGKKINNNKIIDLNRIDKLLKKIYSKIDVKYPDIEDRIVFIDKLIVKIDGLFYEKSSSSTVDLLNILKDKFKIKKREYSSLIKNVDYCKTQIDGVTFQLDPCSVRIGIETLEYDNSIIVSVIPSKTDYGYGYNIEYEGLSDGVISGKRMGGSNRGTKIILQSVDVEKLKNSSKQSGYIKISIHNSSRTVIKHLKMKLELDLE